MTGSAPKDRSLPDLDALTAEVTELVLGTASGCGPGSENPEMEAEAALAGLDSIARLDLLAVLERRFDVPLTEDLTPEFESPKRIARIVLDAYAARPGE